MASDIFGLTTLSPGSNGDDAYDGEMPVLELIDDMAPPLSPREDLADDDDPEDMPELIPKLDDFDSLATLHRMSDDDDDDAELNDVPSFLYYADDHEDYNVKEDTNGDSLSNHIISQDLQQDQLVSDTTNTKQLSSKGGDEKPPPNSDLTKLLERKHSWGSNKSLHIRDIKIILSKLPCFMCNHCRIWYITDRELQKHNQEYHCEVRKQDGKELSSKPHNWLKDGFDSNNNDVIVQRSDGKLHLKGQLKNHAGSRSTMAARRVRFTESTEVRQAAKEGTTGIAANESQMEVAGESESDLAFSATMERYFRSIEESPYVGESQLNVKVQSSKPGQKGISSPDESKESSGTPSPEKPKGIIKKVDNSGKVVDHSRVKVKVQVKGQSSKPGQKVITSPDEYKESSGNPSPEKPKGIVKVEDNSKVVDHGSMKVKVQVRSKRITIERYKGRYKDLLQGKKSETNDVSKKSIDNVSAKRKRQHDEDDTKQQSTKKHANNSVHKEAVKLEPKTNHVISPSKDSTKSQEKKSCSTCHRDKCTCHTDTTNSNTKALVSPEIKQFKCTQCLLKFGSKTLLESHMKHHTGADATFKCEVCNEIFLTSHELAVHSSWHVDRPYKCEFCSKTFLQERPYRIHMNKFHLNEQSSCPLCGARFRDMIQLNRHRQIHVKDLPYLCQHCPQQFKELNDLKKHMMGPKHKDVKEEDWGLEQCYVYKHLTKLKHHERKKPFIISSAKVVVPVRPKPPTEYVDLTL